MGRLPTQDVGAAREFVNEGEGRDVLDAFAVLLGAHRATDRATDALDNARQARAVAIDRLRKLDPPVSYRRIGMALGVTEHAVVATHRRHFAANDVT